MAVTQRSKRVTMQDIARQTGYTVNTVSHALKDLPDISLTTREKIQRVAQEMGYVRNAMASALRSGRTHTLAVIVGDLDNPKFAIMVNDIEAAARAYHCTVIILCTHENEAIERTAIETAVGRQVDGIILNPSQHSDACVYQLQEANVPFVLIERCFDEHEVDCVLCDEEQGGFLAGQHLLELGHRRLVHVCGPKRISSAAARRVGFARAVQGLPEGAVQYLPSAPAAELAPALQRLCRQGFTGAFVFNDMLVWDVAAHAAGDAPLPAFVGYDNIQGQLSFPAPLCSVDVSGAEVCQAAVALLMERIEGATFPPRRQVFPPRLVCRCSGSR